MFAATRLLARRDLGAGILPDRPGPARGELRYASDLAFRLQRGAWLGWAAGYAILGAAFGSIANDIGNVIGDSADVRDALTKLGGTRQLSDAYLSATLQVLALVAAGYAIQATLRLRSEETSGRAEPLLATATSRIVWAIGHMAFALLGTLGLMLVAGAFAGLTDALQTGHSSDFLRVLHNAVLQAPAAWVLGGIALALFGALPRATTAAWGALAICLALAELGPVVDLPQTLMDLSPFVHSPQLGTTGLAPIALTAIAAAFAAAGLAALPPRRPRDIP